MVRKKKVERSKRMATSEPLFQPRFCVVEDPFSTVEWTKRQVCLKDHNDNVMFERVVEAPAHWSEQSVQIVSSRYFYGTDDDEVVEYSIKDLIHRVARTIADWGKADGYFEDADEAEAFYREVAWLCLHQHGAFNSPVWFNCGLHHVHGLNDNKKTAYVWNAETGSVEKAKDTLEHPQLSACFIISVEDNMESIMELAATEAMLFKYGSGAGTNNSTLRSSHERLSGTSNHSSGPLSFMRIRDQVAQVVKSGGKCYRRGSLVATPDGMVPIETLRIGSLVNTHRGVRRVADFLSNGYTQCYRVTTHEGYEIEVTRGHKFAYWDTELGEFLVKPVEQFQAGENLYVLVQPCEGGRQIALREPDDERVSHETTTIEMGFPTVLDDKMAYVLGLLYGDGCAKRDLWRIDCVFADDETGRESMVQYESFCKDLFGDAPFDGGGDGDCSVLSYTRKRLYRFLEHNGLLKGKAEALRFPDTLMTATPAVRAAFVAGLFDADGNYQRRGGFVIRMIDKAFLKKVQMLLLSLGLPSKLTLAREAVGEWQDLWRLVVCGSTFTMKVYELLSPYSPKARKQFVHSDGADEGWGYGDVTFKDVHRFAVCGQKTYLDRKLGSNNTTVGYGAMCAVAEEASETALGDVAERLVSCVPVKLETVESTVVDETFDVEVEDQHLLCVNGLYASNTRRAAKMEVLNVDHPDILDFVQAKSHEEEKARALVQYGYSAGMNGEAYGSVLFQNSNFSVRIPDRFMRAYENGEDWETKAVRTRDVVQTYKAREVMREVAQACHLCGDPGVQFHDTFNRWHTCKATGPINATNPCVTGDTKIYVVENGVTKLKRIDAIKEPTVQVVGYDFKKKEPVVTNAQNLGKTRQNAKIVKIKTAKGDIRLTPDHEVMTQRGWVKAGELNKGDKVYRLKSTLVDE
jgi:hypothetical protein